jgi:hypothetical protein
MSRRRLLPIVAPSLVAGVALGMLASNVAGSTEYLTEPLHAISRVKTSMEYASNVTPTERVAEAEPNEPVHDIFIAVRGSRQDGSSGGDTEPAEDVQPEEPAPISTINIRRQWLEKAISETPESPLWGHGVAMLVDDTEEAQRMGIAGTLTYPHNSLVESAYSLGLLGFVPFVALLTSAGWALVRLIVRGPPPVFTAAFAAFAFTASMTSGEIGADAPLWAAAALAIALYADSLRNASTR